MTDASWILAFTGFDGEEEPLRESLCTLGNGYFATRGAAEEVTAGGCHYPGTYLAGGYDRAVTRVSGMDVENEDLVNWPNWLCLRFRAGDGPWLTPSQDTVLSYDQNLNLEDGYLERVIRYEDADGHVFHLRSRRFVHMENPHWAGIAWDLTSENFEGVIEVETALDGTVKNTGVERYRNLESQHIEAMEPGYEGPDGLILAVRTRQSRITMAQSARTRVYDPTGERAVERENVEEPGRAVQRLRFSAEPGHTVTVEKLVTLFTSRDFAISEPIHEARRSLSRLERFDPLLERQRRAWKRLWRIGHIGIEGAGEDAPMILRLHIFHLLQTCSFNTIDLDAGVPARGLHGEAYRGHIFWDELFIFPFLNFRLPALTRDLLMYRFRRLDEARHAAQEAGFRGAMYPWQSGSNGREESQRLHLNPKSGRWIPDNTFRQRHVNLAVAYNVWQYFQVTEDREFLAFYGIEIVLEIARFLASLAKYDSETDRYHIRGVVGPDEFHTGYPGRERQGLDDNAYTNVLAAWVLWRALELRQSVEHYTLDNLEDRLRVTPGELELWDRISRRLYVPFLDEEGLLAQFEGYGELAELDWEAYTKRYGDISRLDRILEAEGEDPNAYKAAKQADVLMLFYLFSREELEAVITRLGYPFSPDFIRRNICYYKDRTTHGSTLSRLVHAWVLSRLDREESSRLFLQALRSDVEDTQGGTTPEGIHLGAMAGTVDLVQRCFAGLEARDDVLWFSPELPHDLTRISFRVRYRGHWLLVKFEDRTLEVSLERGATHPAKIGVQGQVYALPQGETKIIRIPGRTHKKATPSAPTCPIFPKKPARAVGTARI